MVEKSLLAPAHSKKTKTTEGNCLHLEIQPLECRRFILTVYSKGILLA